MHLDHDAVGGLIREIEAAAKSAIAGDPMDAETLAASARDELGGIIKLLGVCRASCEEAERHRDNITRATVAQTTIQNAATAATKAQFQRLPRRRGGILA